MEQWRDAVGWGVSHWVDRWGLEIAAAYVLDWMQPHLSILWMLCIAVWKKNDN